MTFDEDIDLRKDRLRIDRWHQILRFQRKPNQIQRQILRESMASNLAVIAVFAAIAYAIY
jgi:hypothetical protein